MRKAGGRFRLPTEGSAPRPELGLTKPVIILRRPRRRQGECVLREGEAEEGQDGVGMTTMGAQARGDAVDAGLVEQADGGIAQPGHDAGTVSQMHQAIVFQKKIWTRRPGGTPPSPPDSGPSGR